MRKITLLTALALAASSLTLAACEAETNSPPSYPDDQPNDGSTDKPDCQNKGGTDCQ